MAKDNDKAIKERWGKRNLEDVYITTLAAAQWATPEDYGKILDKLYDHTIVKAPDQDTWNVIALDQQPNGEYGSNGLKSEGGVISKGALKLRSANTLIQSLACIKVSDALKYVGASGNVSDKYKDKYVSELTDEEKGSLFNGYATSTTHQRAVAVLEAERQAIAGNLEKMFNPPEDSSGGAPASSGSSGSRPKRRRKAK